MALGLTPIQIIEKGTHPQLVIADDWKRVELKHIATVQNGFAFSSKLFNHKEGLPLIRIRDIFSSETQNLYSGEYKDEFLVLKGDILIGMDGDFKVSKWPGKKGLLNQRVCRILFNSNHYEKEFLFLCIQPYLDAIHSETSAVTVKHLSSRTINNIPFPLPPLVEQKAIVKKIEELFSSLDSGIADLKKAQNQLVIYRQAVLKKAFEGELTKEWREKQTNLPSADKLLKQIKEERQKHYEQQLADWKEAVKIWERNGKDGKKPKKPTILKSELDLSKLVQQLTDLPNKWTYINLDYAVYKLGDGLHGTPKYSETGDYYFINGNNLDNGKINIKPNTKRVDYSEYLKYKKDLNKDTVFVSINGTIGNVSFYNNEKVILGKSACYFNLLSGFEKNYIKWRIDSLGFRNYAFKNATGSTIKNVPLSAMRNYTFPLCSKEEQHQIILEIESRLSVCDKVEESIIESLHKAQALRQSILKKAFEGKLLSEKEIAKCKADKDYEPASVLLERIKAEKKKK